MSSILHENPFSGSITMDPNVTDRVATSLGNNIAADANLAQNYMEGNNSAVYYDVFMREVKNCIDAFIAFIHRTNAAIARKISTFWEYIKSFFTGNNSSSIAATNTPLNTVPEIENTTGTAGAIGIDFKNILNSNNTKIILGILVAVTAIAMIWKLIRPYILKSKNDINIDKTNTQIDNITESIDMMMTMSMNQHDSIARIVNVSNDLVRDGAFVNYMSSVQPNLLTMLKSLGTFIPFMENNNFSEGRNSIPMISLKNRVDAIIKNSTAYQYYLNTPLNELKTRDEKLIKQELERRQLMMLSEGPASNTLDLVSQSLSNNPISNDIMGDSIKTSAAAAAREAGLEKFNPDASYLLKESTLWDEFKAGMQTWIDWISENLSAAWEWVKSIWDKFMTKIMSYFDNSMASNVASDTVSNVDTGPQPVGGIGNNITNIMSSDTAKIGIGVLLAITAIVAIWKIVKHYIKDDGTPTNTPENSATETNQLTGEEMPMEDAENPTSESYNPMYNNIAYAILEAANTEDDEEKATEIATGDAPAARNPGILASFTNKMAVNLVDDPKFCEHMRKASPQLLEALQKYVNSPIQESVNLDGYGMMSLIEGNMQKKK